MATLRSSLYVGYWLSFIGDFCYTSLTFCTILLATSLGATTLEVGWMGGAYGLVYTITPMILGKATAKMNRKVTLLIALGGLMSMALIFLFFFHTPIQFIIGHAFFGLIYSLFWPASEAFVSEQTDQSQKRHAKSMANYCIGWGMGQVLGSPFGSIFSANGIIIVLVLICIIYTGSFIATIVWIPSKKIELSKPTTGSKIEEPHQTIIQESSINNPENGMMLNNNEITIVIMIAIMVNTFLLKIFTSYFPNYAALPTGLHFDGIVIGEIALAFTLGRLSYFIFGRLWENKFKRYLYGFPIILVGIFALIWVRNFYLFLVIFAVVGFLFGSNYLVSLELMLKYEKKEKSTKAGLLEGAVGIGTSLAPIFAGALALSNLQLPFIVFGFIDIGMIILLFWIRFKKPGSFQ